jgi:hypothetical protein
LAICARVFQNSDVRGGSFGSTFSTTQGLHFAGSNSVEQA